MKTMLLLTAFAAGAACAGTAEVRAVDPKSWRDAGFGETEIGRTTKALADHLQGLAKKLPDGQTLTVELLDVDLAGTPDSTTGSARELRIARDGADVPRIKLRYTLAEGGRTLRQGEDDLTDLSYLRRNAGGITDTRYGHEYRLLDRWFAERVAVRP